MPELTEEMYCHQQICIPPTFPYLLRQYAKAAIRSQPIDLLKWSTSYFRCLSLNIPPPVKPRLEYPIPRDYVGITPGWLRALNYQLQNNLTVPFNILWDRWIGSCLQHDTLIKMLCLGGFTDSKAIPWNRFIGLCAGHLTDNLTQTMILVCEILTEEPEGGSAMITLETFLDVYKFLAAIDASQPQTLVNLYFTDAILNLYEKEKKKAQRMASLEEIGSEESSTVTPEEIIEEQEPEVTDLGEGSIISCPDIVSDDALQEPELVEKRMSEEEVVAEVKSSDEDEEKVDELRKVTEADLDRKSDEDEEEPAEDVEDVEYKEEVEYEGEEAQAEDEEQKVEEEEQKDYDEDEEEGPEEDEKKEEEEEERDEDKEDEKDEDKDEDKDEEEVDKTKSAEEQLTLVAQDILEKGGIEVDEEQADVEPDDETASKITVAEDAMKDEIAFTDALALRELQGEGGFYEPLDELEHHIRIKYQDVGVDDQDLAQEEIVEEEEPAEEVQIDAIPGIGPVVPDELVEAVVLYLTKVSAEEHGMTMPRHVRHYNCPPLEVYQ